MSANQGFERVAIAPRHQGRFTSPNSESMGRPINLRLPDSLEKWVSNEAQKQGVSKNEVIRAALAAQRKLAS